MMRTGVRVTLGALAIAVAALGAPPRVRAQAAAGAFPHARHARVFPTCRGCHAGIATGDSARFFPTPALCADCHNGSVESRVQWAGAAPVRAGLLAFSHQTHFAKTPGITCAACHAAADSSPWMSVLAASPERCLTCHAHAAAGHLAADNTCATCHRPLAAAPALTVAQIASLPRPPSHGARDFLTAHGALARANVERCAVCHARESCARCHVDVTQTPAIMALASDDRVARLERGREPVYPTPSDHRTAEFALAHGTPARASPERCAVCHARESCQTCHVGEGARDVLRKIPSARSGGAPGVQLHQVTPAAAPAASGTLGMARFASLAPRADTAPPDTVHRVRVHPADFVRTHGAIASSGELQCSSCHTQSYCSQCHAGERVTRRYHPANFLASHAPQAYGRESDCASCHSTEAFCRSCHRQAGLAAKTNARSTVFHNAEPLWLLQHGGAARQDINACATCHQQTYCLQCHSDLGSRINPHGPDFDAARMQRKNPQLCLVCHFTNPLGK